jgi:chemotaxis protein MotB
MVSYVDVLTILLVFFVVGAARSLQVPVAPRLAPPVAKSVAAPEVTPASEEAAPTPEEAAPTPVETAPVQAEEEPSGAGPEPLRANLIRAQRQLREQGLDATLEARGLVISLPRNILFPSGEDALNPRAIATIAPIARVLLEIPNHIRLIGYADAVPIHNRRFANNWQLSMARGQELLTLLTKRYGITESRLSIASYGPYQPAAPNDTEDGRALNRRVEIVILDDAGGETTPAR